MILAIPCGLPGSWITCATTLTAFYSGPLRRSGLAMNPRIGPTITPTRHEVLAFDLLFNNPFVHSSVMMRRDAVLSVGGYTTDPSRQPPEDYEPLVPNGAQGADREPRGAAADLQGGAAKYVRGPVRTLLDRLVTISCWKNLALASGRSVGDIHAENLAAYTHSALHRLSQRTDFPAMTAIIADAAKSISADDPEVQSKAA